jgi:hypothetical protein
MGRAVATKKASIVRMKIVVLRYASVGAASK